MIMLKTKEELKGLTKETIIKISELKKEPLWMREFRLQAYEKFLQAPLPSFGPNLKIDFKNILYYKSVEDKVHQDWKNVSPKVRETFEKIGIPEAEKKYLGGTHAQYESEVIYSSMLNYIKEKGVIFLDTDSALKEYPDLFKKYFNNLVKDEENKFTSLNSSVWSGGTFIYVPKGIKVKRPLQSYFRMNTKDMGQFERTIIIVDDGGELDYIEGCTALTYLTDSLHAAVVEIYVGKNARCRYTTIQNWAPNIYNLVTKRAIVEEGGLMEWIDGNIGSKVNMKYPSIILKGPYSRGTCITIAVADKNQIQDTGAKMIHLAPHTKSNILSKSIVRGGGEAIYRGTVNITKEAFNSYSNVQCDTVILDKESKSDALPRNIVSNKSSVLEHEATVSKISEEQLFYLMSRGINNEKATELIIMGFIETFRQELPLEYAVELNKLLKNELSC